MGVLGYNSNPVDGRYPKDTVAYVRCEIRFYYISFIQETCGKNNPGTWTRSPLECERNEIEFLSILDLVFASVTD